MASDCTMLKCCLPNPFASAGLSAATEYISAELTLSCGAGSVTTPIVVPAGAFSSLESQEVADRKALQFAQLMRKTDPCEWLNAEQTVTVDCVVGSGSSTVTIPAGSVSSAVSQADADAQALAEATTQAQETLVCT